jgi:hypothetical protein
MAQKQIWSSVGEFVTEGTMLAVALHFPGQSVPPPAGETAIACMQHDPAGGLYCGTAGSKAHLLAALLRGDTGVVFDLGSAPGAASIDAIAVGDEHVCALASGPDGAALWRWPRFARNFLIQEWTLSRHAPEKVCDLFSGARVAGAAAAPDGTAIYGITDPPGELFRLDATSWAATILCKVDGERRFGRCIALDRSGRVWGTRGPGTIWRCDPHTGRIDDVAAIPAAAGRAQHTQASAWALDEATGRLYGGTTPDGFLFHLDPETAQATALGKPTRLEEVNCLTVGRDGRVFGACGLEEDIGHLFCYEPDRGALRDLGIPVSTLAARQYGYHFRCMLTGRDGEIYLGQHERISHLWIYFPPVPRRAAPAPRSPA